MNTQTTIIGPQKHSSTVIIFRAVYFAGYMTLIAHRKASLCYVPMLDDDQVWACMHCCHYTFRYGFCQLFGYSWFRQRPCWSDTISRDHYSDVIMGAMASQITSLTIVYSSVCSGANQIKHQSSASLAFARGIHLDRWIPRTKDQ